MFSMLCFFFFFNDTATTEIYTLLYTLSLHDALPISGLKSSNAQKEYYLTDIVEAAIRQGRKVAAYIARDSIEALGVNTRAELAAAERILRDRVRGNLMEAGATFLEPETCFVDHEVRIGRDTVITRTPRWRAGRSSAKTA